MRMGTTEVMTEDDYMDAEEPPSMDGLPVIGNLPAILDSPFEFSERLPEFRGVVRVRLAPNDLLSALIAATENGTLSPTELRDQLFIFLLAGHETTSLALTFACFHLAAHPERCERLYAEIDALDGDPSIGTLGEVPASEYIAKEALRLYPPSIEVARESTDDVELQGYRIPEGAGMILPVYSVHRDERWWDEPESFRPERWEEEDVPNHEYAYFSFGGGPRACIGNCFAALELRLVLATIAHRYRLDLAPGQSADLDLRMTPTPAPAEPIGLIARER